MAIRMIVPAVRGQGFGLGRNQIRRQKVSSEKQAKTKDLNSAIDTTVVAILRLLRLTSRTRIFNFSASLVFAGFGARACPTL